MGLSDSVSSEAFASKGGDICPVPQNLFSGHHTELSLKLMVGSENE